MNFFGLALSPSDFTSSLRFLNFVDSSSFFPVLIPITASFLFCSPAFSPPLYLSFSEQVFSFFAILFSISFSTFFSSYSDQTFALQTNSYIFPSLLHPTHTIWTQVSTQFCIGLVWNISLTANHKNVVELRNCYWWQAMICLLPLIVWWQCREWQWSDLEVRNDVVTPGRRLITQVAQVGSSITRGIKIAITISHEKFIQPPSVVIWRAQPHGLGDHYWAAVGSRWIFSLIWAINRTRGHPHQKLTSSDRPAQCRQ